MELAGLNAAVDLRAPESCVKKAAVVRAKYHLPDFTGKSEGPSLRMLWPRARPIGTTCV